MLIRRPQRPSRRALPFIVASGVLWFALYNVVLNAGERYVDAGTAAMLVNVGPILIAILGGLFLGEGFPPRLIYGSLVAFAGATVIGLATSSGAARSRGRARHRPLPRRRRGVRRRGRAAETRRARHARADGHLARLPRRGGRARAVRTVAWWARLATATPESLAWLVYLGVFPTGIAFTTWAFALNRTTAGRLGSTTYLVPAIAIVLGWFVLGEIPPIAALVGGAIAIGGVVIARSRSARPAAAPTHGPAPR